MQSALMPVSDLNVQAFQECLFPFHPEEREYCSKNYGDSLTVMMNRKGVVDVDTVKGCTFGMQSYPDGGCYGECYAAKIARMYGFDFTKSVVRKFVDHREHRDLLIRQLLESKASWYRIGVTGDPCHDWNNTLNVIRCLQPSKMVAVIVTKHWIPLSEEHISKLMDLDVIVHTSTSGMDTDAELDYRINQIERLRSYGIPSVNRVVTCQYGTSAWARRCEKNQKILLSLEPIIDNPLRVGSANPRVEFGDIIAETRSDSVGGGKTVSAHTPYVFLGNCPSCPDQCGMNLIKERKYMPEETQASLFGENATTGAHNGAEFKYVKSVIGSGYEKQVAELALEDGIAHRAARKNMQIHSAIILLIDGEFAGFFTFQNNTEIGEFCLLQSVIKPAQYTPELYRQMAQAVVRQNTNNFPMLMTTNPKSKFETPKMFNGLGFQTYLKMSGFEYMLAGDQKYYRMKQLAHITMTNVWDSCKGDWVRFKKEWNVHIAEAGIKNNIPNPTFATREGCWQGESGFSNVVTGRSHNGNASVLDPVACEVILRFFTPKGKPKVYNPFGGGVQFGYVSGASGYEYLASEIRGNQCDANNALCREFDSAVWVQADSSKWEPPGKYDLVFTCPPYYRVERYVDYDGNPPAGEINAMATYEEFRNTLFRGYEIAIEHLNDNRFFVVMTGDSRGKNGAYHCHECETEIFFKEHGLNVYNKIIFLESEFTRLAQAKKTLNMRKFPKREQRIIVAYKGKVDAIKEEFAPIGRL